jgi:preprotein translocase subunit SecD
MKNFVFLALMLASPVLADTKPQIFYIGTEAFQHDDILDARALPDIDGSIGILVTFSETASSRVARITRQNIGKSINLRLGETILASPIVREAIEGGSVQISINDTLDGATALAKKISGKEPLPDSLDGE